MQLSIVIPAFNERQRLEPTLVDLHSTLAPLYRAFEIVVVDDGSTDGTGAWVSSLQARFPELRLVSLPGNRGKGNAVRRGMLEARGAVRVMCDADGAMSAEQLERLVGPVSRNDVDIAIGSRYVDGGHCEVAQPAWRQAWSRLVRATFTRSLVPGVQDAHCGYKAFSEASAIELFGRSIVDGWVFDLEVLALAYRLGFRIREVGVAWRDDARSRVNPLMDVVRIAGGYRALRRSLSAQAAPGAKTPRRTWRAPTANEVRLAAEFARAAAFEVERPLMVHLCVTRRCNLRCGYCYEYDGASAHVPLGVLKERIDHLARLKTVMVNLNGGEPLLHPDIASIVAHVTSRGMFPVMNSNGFLLTHDLVHALEKAGLVALQVSLDAVEPNDVTQKAYARLLPKLELLSQEAKFRVRVNTVLGAASPGARPEDHEAVRIARAALALGFDAKCSFMRDEKGAMLPLSGETHRAYRSIQQLHRRSPPLLGEDFMDELARAGRRDWKCRSGARYFWVCEDGRVHLCESSYGEPGTPLLDYRVEDIRAHYATSKSCSEQCAVAYAHQLSRFDQRRPQPRRQNVVKQSWLGGKKQRLSP